MYMKIAMQLYGSLNSHWKLFFFSLCYAWFSKRKRIWKHRK